MVGRRALAVAATAFMAHPALAATNGCTYSSMGTTYNLESMTVGASSTYTVKDVRDTNTIYYFNVCGQVQPPVTTPAGQCATGGRTAGASPAAAWQVETLNNPDTCYRLGNATAGWTFSPFGVWA